MNTTQRRYEIYEKLKKDKTVQVSELAKVYSVSLMTIRRDLDSLENQGLATKRYGGATLNESSSTEPSFEIKEGMSQSDKKEIAIMLVHSFKMEILSIWIVVQPALSSLNVYTIKKSQSLQISGRFFNM